MPENPYEPPKGEPEKRRCGAGLWIAAFVVLVLVGPCIGWCVFITIVDLVRITFQ